MATYELGKIGLNLRGDYSTVQQYEKMDMVYYGGSTYVAKDSVIGVAPTNTAHWILLAQGTAGGPVWNYPSSLQKGTTPGDYGSGRLRYGKIGNHVFIVGSINITPGSNLTIFTLPNGYYPVDNNTSETATVTATALKPCSGSRVARIAVYPDGTFRLEWVKNLADGENYTSGSIWVDCSIDFWI